MTMTRHLIISVCMFVCIGNNLAAITNKKAQGRRPNIVVILADDLGWGGDVKAVREHLPDTFLNIRLDPVQLVNWSPEEIREIVTRPVTESADPERTGVCCINMDENVEDEQVDAVFETVGTLRNELS